ncbi:branched-chain amino acid transport system II carrier protein [Eggerthella sinensis]|uniref:branched-chain amino acid transport system II carrier protein n=1 Tax=Eggerthella sinensis TaxID=242230 RepID=UPI001D0841AD|nr:branched-chain amino acid transport system II carrier protein [Eggerthella sinensis]MCB7037084.1 branched-chain amino acid transport system II carrier protein [Eggerthella sinensis]
MASGREHAGASAGDGAPRGAGLRPAQLLAVGGMLFSMFFGAGNLILPPLLGLQAGSEAVSAMAGFLAAGIGLPVLGIVAVAVCGGVRELAGRVSPLFASVFIALMYLTIGPFLAIPRTSSTAFEMLKPLLPAADAAGATMMAVVFSVAFFGVAFALALRPGLLSRVLGRFSAPALILLIVLVVGASVLGGAGEPAAPHAPYAESAVSHGFLTGYQTMDLLAALCFGIVVAANVRELGVSDPKRVAGSISSAGVIAGALMMAIYCGLGFVGASMGAAMPDATNGAAILTASASAHFGAAGTVIVAAIFLLACLNVCTGLISCCSEYFSEAVPRVPLAAWAALFAVFSCAVSLLGLDAILAFSAPLLGALYPPAIVLVIMGLLHRQCDRLPRMWPWAVLVTAAFSVIVGLRDAFAPGLWLPLDALPFAAMGLGWVLPAVAGAVVGAVLSRAPAPSPRSR